MVDVTVIGFEVGNVTTNTSSYLVYHAEAISEGDCGDVDLDGVIF